MCLLLFQSKISMKHGKNTSLNKYFFGKKRRNNAKLANAQKCSFQSIQVPFDCMLKMNVNTTFFHMPINTTTTTTTTNKTTKACSLQFRLMWMAFRPSVYGEMIVQAVVGRWRLTQQKRGTHFHRLIFLYPDAPWDWNIYLHESSILGRVIFRLVNDPLPQFFNGIIANVLIWSSKQSNEKHVVK